MLKLNDIRAESVIQCTVNYLLFIVPERVLCQKRKVMSVVGSICKPTQYRPRLDIASRLLAPGL